MSPSHRCDGLVPGLLEVVFEHLLQVLLVLYDQDARHAGPSYLFNVTER